MGENNFYKNDFSQEGLYQFQSDAITKAAREGNCVFVGRTADYVLRDFPNTVNIFITASFEERIKRVCERQQLTADEAMKYINAREEARSTYYNYYTGKRWGAAESYDLCVSSSILGLDETATFITSFIKKRFEK
jgi:cytidylate kinase